LAQGAYLSLMAADIARRRVDVRIIIDFMCPWSLIGLRSFQVARASFESRLDLSVQFVPFEFDPPGTYPAEGLDWTEYCRGYGPAKAKFLLEEKLPRAFAFGQALGIQFRMDRRIVDTLDVNTALVLAQERGVAEAFAVATLRAHFEKLEDPNDRAALGDRLSELGVPREALDAALDDPSKATENERRTAEARRVLRGGVPQFEVRCAACDGGADQDLCLDAPGGPTSPDYFARIFAQCAGSGGEEATPGQSGKDEL